MEKVPECFSYFCWEHVCRMYLRDKYCKFAERCCSNGELEYVEDGKQKGNGDEVILVDEDKTIRNTGG